VNNTLLQNKHLLIHSTVCSWRRHWHCPIRNIGPRQFIDDPLHCYCILHGTSGGWDKPQEIHSLLSQNVFKATLHCKMGLNFWSAPEEDIILEYFPN